MSRGGSGENSYLGTEASSVRRYLSRRAFLGGAAASAGALAVGDSTAGAPECSFVALPEDFIYLNSGTEGSMPDCVMQRLNGYLRQWAADPTDSYETDPVLGKRQPENRRSIESFLGAKPYQVCLTDNTTMGLSLAITGIDMVPGDKVLTTNHEHSATISPLQVMQQRSGIEVIARSFPDSEQLDGFTAAGMLDYLFPNTEGLRGAKALCVSHVYPGTGIHLPLDLLRQKADELRVSYLIVDGAQAFGMFDLTDEPGSTNAISACDFYACPGHKWLNGPPGTGFLYLKNAAIRPPEFYPMLSQRMSRFIDSTEPYYMAQALQVRGCMNLPGFAAMVDAMSYQEQFGGPKSVEARILALSRRVTEFIHNRAPECLVSPHADSRLHSGLTVFFPFDWKQPDTPLRDKAAADAVVHGLRKHNIQIRSIGIPRPNGAGTDYALRVSTAVFNTPEQIGIFASRLKGVLTAL